MEIIAILYARHVTYPNKNYFSGVENKMEKRVLQSAQANIALIHSDTVLIHNGQSALDLIATVFYDDNCSRMAINKEALCEDFFVLSTGIAGEVLQKAVNYRMKLAIVGDFSRYTSKPLQDFIYECNNGRDVFFVANEAAAVDRLKNAR